MKVVFGDIVVVDEDQIGVVVKNWAESSRGDEASAEVYVRSYNDIRQYPLSKVERYQVRHKELDEAEREYQTFAEQDS